MKFIDIIKEARDKEARDKEAGILVKQLLLKHIDGCASKPLEKKLNL